MVTVAAALAVVAFGIVSRLNDIGVLQVRGADRDGLRPVLLLDDVVVACLQVGLLATFRSIPETPAGRLLQLLGRNSLFCFCCSVVLTYLLFAGWLWAGRPYWLYLALEIALVAMTALLADWYAETRTARRRQKRLGGTQGAFTPQSST